MSARVLEELHHLERIVRIVSDEVAVARCCADDMDSDLFGLECRVAVLEKQRRGRT